MLRQLDSNSSLEITLTELKSEKEIMFKMKRDMDAEYAPSAKIEYGMSDGISRRLPEMLKKYIEDHSSELVLISTTNKWWYVEGKSFSEEHSICILHKIDEAIITLRFRSFPFPILNKTFVDDCFVIKFESCGVCIKPPAVLKLGDYGIRRSYENGQMDGAMTVVAEQWLHQFVDIT